MDKGGIRSDVGNEEIKILNESFIYLRLTHVLAISPHQL
jgi:hypothetical protein